MGAHVLTKTPNRMMRMVVLIFFFVAFCIEGVYNCKTTLDLAVDWDMYYLTSPKYPLPAPRNEDLCWRLSINPSYEQNKYLIRVLVEDAVLGKTRPCSTEDNLVIYDGGSTSSTQLRQLCDRDEPGDVKSTGSHLLIRFRTSSPIGGRGFKLAFWAEPKLPVTPGNINCTQIQFNATHKSQWVFIRPRRIGNGKDASFSPTDGCWQVKTNQNQERIVQKMEAFIMDVNKLWMPIFTETYDGPTSTSPLLLRTATRKTDELARIDAYSTTNQLYLRLHMAVNNLFYKALKLSPALARITFTSMPRKDIKPEAEKCSMESFQGTKPYVLKSSQYPLQTYAPYDRCWLFNVTGDVCLRLLDFYLKPSSNCQKNYLEIREGSDVGTSAVLHRWCGVMDPDEVGLVCIKQTALIRYHIEDLPEKGFSMLLYSVDYEKPPNTPCTILTASNREQILESPGYSDASVQNADLCWVIKTGSPMAIVHVEMLDYIPRDNCIFHLSVRDGNSTVAPLLSKKCELEPRYYRSSGTQLYVRYQTTTASKVRKGFKLRFMEIQRVSSERKCADVRATKEKVLWDAIKYPRTLGNFDANYTSNMDVCWRIRGNTFDRVLEFSNYFNKFDLESSPGCTKDYVEILDGSTTLDPVLWRGCGQQKFLRGLVTKKPYALVRFHSDQEINAKGFRIPMVADGKPEMPCQKLYAKNAMQLLEAPSFERNEVFCWIMETEGQDHIVYVELSSGMRYSCKADLYFKDGNVSYADTIAYGYAPRIVSSTARYMYVQYKTKSDSSGSSKCGFKLLYYQVPKATMQRNITKITLAYGKTNEMTSPNYPQKYPNDIDKCWQITSNRVYQNPLIEVRDLQLEDSPGCKNDYLEVRAGPGIQNTFTKRLCGNTVLKPIYMPRQFAFICFHSNNAINDKGFKITLFSGERKEKHCTKTVQEVASRAAQYIISPGYPKEYEADLALCWKITVPDYLKRLWRRIHIEVETIDLEPHGNCSYDYIAIRDEMIYHDRVRWCGNDTNTKRTASSTWDKMYVIFITDINKNFKGFKLRYWLFGDKCDEQLALPDMTKDISSPEHPRQTRNIDMCWIINRPLFRKLNLKITDVQLSGNCSTNFVEVREGKKPDSKLLTRLCEGSSVGKSNPADITITSESLFIRYQAGNSGGRFAGKFKAYEDDGLSSLKVVKIVVPIVGVVFILVVGFCGSMVYKKQKSNQNMGQTYYSTPMTQK